LNAFKVIILDHWSPPRDDYSIQEPDARSVELFIQKLWVNHFKLPIDEIPGFEEGCAKKSFGVIRQRFFASDAPPIHPHLDDHIATFGETALQNQSTKLSSQHATDLRARPPIGAHKRNVNSEWHVKLVALVTLATRGPRWGPRGLSEAKALQRLPSAKFSPGFRSFAGNFQWIWRAI
jgi:hypothetical protein